MEPKISISDRYGIKSENLNGSIEFPKNISKKRVIKQAWTLFKNEAGVPGYFNLKFCEALKISWEREINMIKSGGAIYYPYVMAK